MCIGLPPGNAVLGPDLVHERTEWFVVDLGVRHLARKDRLQLWSCQP
jgi:hypothetical protein